jgi:hypothetical protein
MAPLADLVPRGLDALLVGADDVDLRALLVELLAELGVGVLRDGDGGAHIDVVISFAERGDVELAVRDARHRAPLAAILVVVPFHEDELRASAADSGADGYHALDGATGDLRASVVATMVRHLERTGATRG